MVETGSALLIVLGCLALLRVLLQWTGLAGGAAKRGSLRVVETCALGSRKRLHVVEIAGERLLIGSSENGLAMLHHLPEASEPETEPVHEKGTSPMPALLRRLIQTAGTFSFVLLGSMLLGDPVFAEGGLTIRLEGLEDPEQLTSTLEMVALFTLVSVAPSILLMATSFTRIVIVLGFLRQAIGVQQLPPNQVLVGLALFTTMFVMAPLGEQIRIDAYEPYIAKEIGAAEAAELAIGPVRTFLLESTRESDLSLFLEFSGTGEVENLADVPFTALLPSYMLSELRIAFEIGFMIYLPFLVVDLVIASMLISMGMIVLPPIVISLPFKLMLFVLLDGWNLVLGSLMSGLR